MVASRLFWTVAIVGAIVDLATKSIIFGWIGQGEFHTVIDGFFRLSHVRNRGGVWGMGQNLTEWFAVVRFAALFVILYLLKTTRTDSRCFLAGLGLIFGGAIGNLFDTVYFGHVRDFLEFDLQFMIWPTFNIADSCITVGAFLLFLFFLRGEHAVGGAADGGTPGNGPAGGPDEPREGVDMKSSAP